MQTANAGGCGGRRRLHHGGRSVTGSPASVLSPSLKGADMFMWITDWAWSLPLILLTVVIHVFGLGVINEKVVRTLSRSTNRRALVSRFALVMGVAVLLM